MKKILLSLIFGFVLLWSPSALLFAADNVANDNLVQSWNQMSQGMSFNPVFQGGEAQRQNLPGYPNMSNPGTPTHVPGQMPGTHPNFTGREYYQFLGGRLVVEKDKVTGAEKQLWRFQTAPVFDAFTLQPYIAAGREQGAKYKITATWPKALESGEISATYAMNEKALAVYDMVPVSVFALEGENVPANPFYLLSEAHEAARKAGFHLLLLEQGGFYVSETGHKGASFSIGLSSLFNPFFGGGGGIGPYYNTFSGGTPVIPWFRFQALASRAVLEAKKAELRKNGKELKKDLQPEDTLAGWLERRNGKEGRLNDYIPVVPGDIIPLPEKEKPAVVVPEKAETPAPAPAPPVSNEKIEKLEKLEGLVRDLNNDLQKEVEEKGRLQDRMGELEKEKQKLAQELTDVEWEATQVVDFVHNRVYLSPVQLSGKTADTQLEAQADELMSVWHKLIKLGKKGTMAIVAGCDETPGLNVWQDTPNPKIGEGRAAMNWFLIKPLLKKQGLTDKEINGIALLTTSNLRLVKKTGGKEQANRISYFVYIPGGLKGISQSVPPPPNLKK